MEKMKLMFFFFLLCCVPIAKAADIVALSHSQVKKVICVGASITEGALLENPKEDSYPGKLQALLGAMYKVENYGAGGTTMLRKGNFPYWDNPAYQAALKSNPDIVFIDLGGNDAKVVNYPFYNDLVKDCRSMIQSFAKLPSKPRILVLLPFVSFEKDSSQIWDKTIVKEIIPRLKEAAEKENVEVLDMHSLLAGRSDLFPDGIHPDKQGHKIIARKMFYYLNKLPYSDADIYGRKYDSYKGLMMAGYQGWFSAPGDGSGRGWYHYQKRGRFAPGSTNVDFWPDMTEYEKVYKTEFVFADGRPAYTFSSYDASTVHTHFKWMREYGVDGVFVQRFVTEIKNETSYKQLNKVFDSAINAADLNNRAISIMYDLSGMLPGDEQLVLKDIDALSAKYDLKERKNNTSYLHHNGKPLVAVWGVGFNDRRRYGFRETGIIIDEFKKRGFSVLIGVPTNWRKLENDTLDDPKLHELILECDIVMPWLVGRFNENSFAPFFADLVKEDIQWCKKNKIDYAPLIYPGFSWRNMNGPNATHFPRNRGSFYWKQIYSHITNGAEMFYVAMFDEIDEGTAIFKCATEVPVGESRFVPIEKGLKSDFYIWLTGEAGKMLRKEKEIVSVVPVP